MSAGADRGAIPDAPAGGAQLGDAAAAALAVATWIGARAAAAVPVPVAAVLVAAALALAVLVGADLTKHRWRPLVHSWMHELRRPHAGWWGPHAHRHADGVWDDDYAEVVEVRSWRPEPLALPMGSPAAEPTSTYVAPTYAVSGGAPSPGRPFPEDDGTLL